VIIALGFFPQVALDVINPSVEQTMTIVGSTDPAPAIAESGK
jgi:NADH-quinone oxidoreductase subunit M